MAGIRYYDVKLTVLKRLTLDDIHAEFAAEGVPRICTRYKEGSEYISKNCNKPDGFCSWAWAELQQKVVFLALGHDYPKIGPKGTDVVCCSDALHPVIYKLERLEEGAE